MGITTPNYGFTTPTAGEFPYSPKMDALAAAIDSTIFAVSGSLQQQVQSVVVPTEKGLVGVDGITITSGTNSITLTGFRQEFIAEVDNLQTQISAIEPTPVNVEPAIVGTDGITVTSGASITSIKGFRDEFLSTIGSIQSQLSAINTDEVEPAIIGTDGIAIVSGTNTISVAGFRTELIGISDSLQTQLNTHAHAHSSLSNLSADDHPQYALLSGARTFTGTIGGVTPTSAIHLATKGYVDGSHKAVVAGSNTVVVSGTDTVTISATVPSAVVPNAIVAGANVTVVSGTDRITISSSAEDRSSPAAPNAIVAGSSNITVVSGANTTTVDLGANPTVTSITANTGDFSEGLTVAGVPVQTSGFTGIQTVKKTADQTFNSATAADVSQLSFSVVSGQYYHFRFICLVRSDTATVGVALTVTTPTFTRFGATASTMIAADGAGGEFQGAISSSGDAVVPTAVPAINTDYLAVVEGLLLPSANGTLHLRARTETGTTVVTVRQGSIGMLYTL